MGNFIQKAITHPGSFTRQADKADMSVSEFASHVKANPDEYSTTTQRRANLAQTLRRLSGKR